jgi:hypothetical protein
MDRMIFPFPRASFFADIKSGIQNYLTLVNMMRRCAGRLYRAVTGDFLL